MKQESKITINAAIYGSIAIVALVFALQMMGKIVNLYFFEPLPTQGILSDAENFKKFKQLFVLAGVSGVGGAIIALLWLPLQKNKRFFSVLLMMILWASVGAIAFLTFIATASSVGEQNIYTQNYPLFETFLNASIPLCVCLFALPFFNLARCKPFDRTAKQHSSVPQKTTPQPVMPPVDNNDDL